MTTTTRLKPIQPTLAPAPTPVCQARYEDQQCTLLAHTEAVKHRSGRGIEWKS